MKCETVGCVNGKIMGLNESYDCPECQARDVETRPHNRVHRVGNPVFTLHGTEWLPSFEKFVDKYIPTSGHVRGVYIGNEERFKGRSALVNPNGGSDAIQAQFDEGELWETHSWLTFPKEDFRLI